MAFQDIKIKFIEECSKGTFGQDLNLGVDKIANHFGQEFESYLEEKVKEIENYCDNEGYPSIGVTNWAKVNLTPHQ